MRNPTEKIVSVKGQPKFWDVENFETSEIIQYCYNERFSIVDPWNDRDYMGLLWSGFYRSGGFAHATNMRSVAEPTTPEYAWQWLGADYRMAEMFYSEWGSHRRR